MAGLISAVTVATVTLAVTAHAVQTIRTANAFTMSFSLSPGQGTGAITVAANSPTLVMGDTTPGNDPGLSEMTVATAPVSIMWNGIESNGGGFTTGVNDGFAGTHMMFIDNMHCVDIEVNSANSFKVVSSNTIRCSSIPPPLSGQVTEVW
jgi:hypothetical protein